MATSLSSEHATLESGVDLGRQHRMDVVERWLFQLLHTLRRKKVEHVRISLFAALLDALQLLPFVINARVDWGEQVNSFSQDAITKLHVLPFLHAAGFSTFTLVFWSALALLLFLWLMCAWTAVSVAHGTVQPFWRLRLVRRLFIFLGNMLFISVLEIFLQPWRCNFPAAATYTNAHLLDFPDVPCWGSDNLTLLVLGTLASVLLILTSLTLVLFQYDCDQRSMQPQALASLYMPIMGVVLRVLCVVLSTALFSIPFWMALGMAAIFCYWAILLHQELPYYAASGNIARAFWHGALAAVSLVQLAAALLHYLLSGWWLLILVLAGVLLGTLLALMVSVQLLKLDGSLPTMTKLNPAGTVFVTVYKFDEPGHVEIATRFLRSGYVDGDRLEQAQAVWAAGLAQFDGNQFLQATHANFLLTYTSDVAKTNHLLENVRRAKPGMIVRYVLHLREQEGQQRRARANVGDTAMDLATYVEFQSQFKLAVRAHRKILLEVRIFWRLVHTSNITDKVVRQYRNARRANAHHMRYDARVLSPPPVMAMSTQAAGNAGALPAPRVFFPPSPVARTALSHLTFDTPMQPASARGFASMASVARAAMTSPAMMHANAMAATPRSMVSPEGPISGHATGGAPFAHDPPEPPGRAALMAWLRSVQRSERWLALGIHRFVPAPLQAWARRLLTGNEHDPSITRAGAVARLAYRCVRIDALALEAERSYTALLERYPRSSKLLRSFARFHFEVNQNQREAERFLAEAERLEESAAEEAVGALNREGQLKATSLVDDSVDSLVVIDTRGTILTVNSNCRRMFGFSESELVGQNVSMLMPPFYAAQHDTFLHNYMTSGVAKVLGTIRRTEAKHKDGHTFPIDLAVNRVDTPQGTTFAGVIHAVPEDETAGLVSITDRGIVISCNMVFARMFGWTVPEAINENIKRFMPREYAKHHDTYLARFKRTRQSKIMNLRGRRLQGLHRNGMVFPVSVEVEAAQLNGSTIFNGRITELAAANGVITIDEKGIVQSCNKAMLSLFGYAAQNDVVGRNVNRLMPEPYATFHDQYLARYVATGTGIIVGAVGRYVTGKHFDGTPFPVFLKVTEIKAKGKHGKRMFGGELSLAQVHAEVMKEGGVVDDVGMGADAHGVDAGADTAEVDPQLGRITINAEGRILYVNSVLPAMFGYTEADLKGENVKKLMPDEIAAQHDHFLRVHLETGENHVIGNMGRHLMAKHADGHLFPVALTVEEESVGGYNTYHGSLRAVAEIEGVVYINLQGRVLHASQGLCYLLGYRQSQIEGRNINIIMPEPYKSKHNTYLRRYRETGRTRFINTRQIVPVMHSDGSTFAAQLEVASVKVPEYGACLAARIIAAAVTAEEALKQARQAVATAKQRDADIAAAEEAAVRAAAEAVEAAERAKTEAEEKERREAAEAAEAEKQRIEEAQLAEERRAPRSHRHRRHGRRRHARGRRSGDDAAPMSNDSRHQDAVNLTRTPSDASYASHDSRSSVSSSDSSSYVGSRATGDTGSSSHTPSTHSRSPASSVVDSYVSSSCASSVVDSSRTGQPRDRRRRRRGQAESDKGSVTHDLPAAIGLQSGRTRSSRSARRTPSGRQLREPEDRRSPETNLAHAKSEAAVASETLVPVVGTRDEEPAASRFGISVDGTRVKAGSVSTPAVAVQSTPTADAAFGRAKASDQAPLLRVSHEHAAAARPRVDLASPSAAAFGAVNPLAIAKSQSPLLSARGVNTARSSGGPRRPSIRLDAWELSAGQRRSGDTLPPIHTSRRRQQWRHGEPHPEDLPFIFSDAKGNAAGFARAAAALGFNVATGEDGLPPKDLHMEGKPGGWVGFYALGSSPALTLPEYDPSLPDWREEGLIPRDNRVLNAARTGADAHSDETGSKAVPAGHERRGSSWLGSRHASEAAFAADGMGSQVHDADADSNDDPARSQGDLSVEQELGLLGDEDAYYHAASPGLEELLGRDSGDDAPIITSRRQSTQLNASALRTEQLAVDVDTRDVTEAAVEDAAVQRAVPPTPGQLAPGSRVSPTGGPVSALNLVGTPALRGGARRVSGGVAADPLQLSGAMHESTRSDANVGAEEQHMHVESMPSFEDEDEVAEADVMYDTQPGEDGDSAEADSRDDASEARSHTSGSSSFIGSTTMDRKRNKHRMRQLKRIRRNQGIRHTSTAMAWTTLAAVVTCGLAFTLLFAVSQAFISKLTDSVPLISAAGDRVTLLQQMAVAARQLQLSVAANDSRSYEIAAAYMENCANVVHARHTALYTDVAADTHLSSAELRQFYGENNIRWRSFLEATAPTTYVTRLMNFWDAVNEYTQASKLLISPAVSNALTDADSGALPLESSSSQWFATNASIRDAAAWRAVMDNNGVVLAHALAFAELELQHVLGYSDQLSSVQLSVLVIELLLPILLLLCCMFPMYQRLLRERAGMFGLFSVIPHKITAKLANMRLRVGSSRDDEGLSESDSEDGAELSESEEEEDVEVSEEDEESWSADLSGTDYDKPLTVAAIHDTPAAARARHARMSDTSSSMMPLGYAADAQDAKGQLWQQQSAGAAAQSPPLQRGAIFMGGTPAAARSLRFAPDMSTSMFSSVRSYHESTTPDSARARILAAQGAGRYMLTRPPPRRSSSCAARSARCCWFSTRLAALLCKRAIMVLLQVLLPLFVCKRPVSMPRKLGYSMLLLLALVCANFTISSTSLEAATANVRVIHLMERREAFSARIRFLSQELVFAQSAWVNGSDPRIPQPSMLSTSPHVPTLRAALRSAVSLSQRLSVTLVTGSSAVDVAVGVGDGFLPQEALAVAAQQGAVFESPEQALLTSGTHSASLVDMNRQALQAAYMYEDADALEMHSPSSSGLTSLSSSLSSDALQSNDMLAAKCSRVGSSWMGASGSNLLRTGYIQDLQSHAALDWGSAYNLTTVPIIVPYDPFACPPSWTPYGPLLSDGLDTSVHAVLVSAWALANDTAADLHPMNMRYLFLMEATSADLPDGTDQVRGSLLAAMNSSFRSMRLSETLIFIMYLSAIATWYLSLLRPYISQLNLEMSRVAALLSFLPVGVDLQKLMSIHNQRRAR